MNITFVHLSAILEFANTFNRYNSKQSTSELSLIVTEMVSATAFFLFKNCSYGRKNLEKIS